MVLSLMLEFLLMSSKVAVSKGKLLIILY
jgi:hypothetical protein